MNFLSAFKHFPNLPVHLDKVSTQALEQFFAYIRQNGDCKSSNTFLEMILKGRKSIQKHYFKMMLDLLEGNEPEQPPDDDVSGMFYGVFSYNVDL